MGVAVIRFLYGYSIGNQFITEKKTEDEMKQGENDFQGALRQAAQVGILANVIQLATEECSPKLKIPFQIFCNFAPIFSYPFFTLLAAIKGGEYPSFAAKWNGKVPSFFQLSRNLSLYPRTVKIVLAVFEHSGSLIRIAIVIGSLVITARGNFVFGGGMVAAFAYDWADRHLLVPRRASLLVSQISPHVTTIAALFDGTVLSRLFNLYSLVNSLRYITVNEALLLKVDRVIGKSVGFNSFLKKLFLPTVEEINAPWHKLKDLTYAEINAIFMASDDQFEINPAHCSKSMGVDHLPEDDNFDQFLIAFDKTDWKKQFQLLYPRLKNDDRFIGFLKMELAKIDPTYGQAHPDEIRKNYVRHVEMMARNAKVSQEQYLADWTRDQIKCLIGILKGTIPVKGTVEDLDEAINSCKKIVPYLGSLEDAFERENLLLQLAVDGGEYCALGIKDASKGVVDEIAIQNDSSFSPLEAYENKILRKLENLRLQFLVDHFDAGGRTIAAKLGGLSRISFVETYILKFYADRHNFRDFKDMDGLGVYPTPDRAKQAFGLISYAIWRYIRIYLLIYPRYHQKIVSVVEESSFAHFWVYMAQRINEMTKLNPGEKEQLIDRFLSVDQSNRDLTKQQFLRLFFVMMGVLRKKQN